MKVIVACECSGRVKTAFRNRGHDAWSCDLKPSEIPDDKYHIQGDVLKHLNEGWDLMIAHPDCTFLTVTGNKWFEWDYLNRFPDRVQQRVEAVTFFMKLAIAPVEKICIENPVGIMSTLWHKPDCIIQPWQFGDKAVKKTCLWLKNLPPLLPTSIVEPEYLVFKSSTHKSGFSKYPTLWGCKSDATERSRTFPGIANAMADQWG